MEGKVCIVSTKCVLNPSSRPQSFLSASLVFHGPHEGGHQGPAARPALCRKKTELLFNRGKGREKQVPWAGLAGSLPFPPPLLILLQACTSPVGAPFPLFLAPFSGNRC